MKKIKGLLYCCKEKPYLIQGLAKPMHTLDTTNPFNFNWKLVNKGFSNDRLNGKIVAECDFEVEGIVCDGYAYLPLNSNPAELETKGCLNEQELENYFTKKYGLVGYAIHIKNLHIFDEPRELSDFNKIIETTYGEEPDATITRAPQNMMRCCYEKKPKEWEKGVLISIQPKELCRVLNGEQTILIKKKVLKEMLEDASK